MFYAQKKQLLRVNLERLTSSKERHFFVTLVTSFPCADTALSCSLPYKSDPECVSSVAASIERLTSTRSRLSRRKNQKSFKDRGVNGFV